MRIRRQWPAVFMLLILTGVLWWSLHEGPEPPRLVALLLPNDVDTQHPVVVAWRQAALIRGVPLAVISDNDFLRPTLKKSARFAGVILPDTLHRAVSSVLIGRLQTYVENGGRLMVVYDAATLSPPGHLVVVRNSYLSKLVGIDYSTYGQPSDPASLALPADHSHIPSQLLLAWLESSARRADLTSLSILPIAQTEKKYTHLGTKGAYLGLPLLMGSDGSLIAGLHQSGKGQVAFVNLELGRLGAESDNVPLHHFLRWFGTDVCGLPLLLSNGGRAEENAHLKSSSPFANMKSLRILNHDRGSPLE